MNEIKTIFSINDLENISGIKAHTIRIWEKRYSLLSPLRASRNIRYYDNDSLKKLLNVVLLNKYGLKISRIANLTDVEIVEKSREYISQEFKNEQALSSFKLSMYQFDSNLFNSTYVKLLKTSTFSEVFENVFIPFLNFIGLFWQTSTISPAHEHFISSLIYQKIQVNSEKMTRKAPTVKNKIFVMFLPEGELHELGLLYLNYKLLSKGYRTIYLGTSIPIKFLKDVYVQFDNVTWISSFIVSPEDKVVNTFLVDLKSQLLGKKGNSIWLVSPKTRTLDLNDNENIKFFISFKEVLKLI